MASTHEYTPRFTLWNKLLSGEIRNVRHKYRRSPFQVQSLLQPMDGNSCIVMLLLFGKVPSWYSFPCKTKLSFHTLICKRKLESLSQTDYALAKQIRNLSCHENAIFVILTCVELKWGLFFSQRAAVQTTSNHYKSYIVGLFSIITRYSLESYQLYMPNTHHENDKPTSCTKTMWNAVLPNDYTKNVRVSEAPCDMTNNSHLFTFFPWEGVLQMPCLPNQFQCSDGTCMSQIRLCYKDVACSPSSCACEMNGQAVRDFHFCHTACMPGKCSCPQHHFQCVCGGCLDMALVCDGHIHCTDASDEICGIRVHVSENKDSTIEANIRDHYFCLGFLCMSRQCLHLRYVNDLLPDCLGGQAEDESHFLLLRYGTKRESCNNPTQFPCVAGLSVCFPLNKLCLYDPDEDGYPKWCKDGVHLGDCRALNCTNSYKCPESYCIPVHRVCDGNSDCIHGEDEEHCDIYICKGLLRCLATKICVHPAQVCDGVKHCPNADDEDLCEANRCPGDCHCLSYSITCITEAKNVLPEITSDVFKQITIINSYMFYPNFHKICNQRNVLFLNLARNHVRDICVSLQDISMCMLRRKIISFDLSYNEITHLRSYCFKSFPALKIVILAYNPLYILDSNTFFSFSILYISIKGSNLKSLYRTSLIGVKTLNDLDITETHLEFVDPNINAIPWNIQYLKFDDPRLCCIFTTNTNCGKQMIQAVLCRTLLPSRVMGYIVLVLGVLSVVYNIAALYANMKLMHRVKHSKLTSYLMFIDATLAMYLPAFSVAHLYYQSNFVLTEHQWRQSILCWLMDNLSAAATILSIYHCGLHIYLMKQAITTLAFGIGDQWHSIICSEMIITALTVLFRITINLVKISETGFQTCFLCNVMGDSEVTTNSGVMSTVTFCIFMGVSQAFITILTAKIIGYIKKTTTQVKGIRSESKVESSQDRTNVRNFLLSFLATKAMIYLPYPLLQLWCLFSHDAPRTAFLYVMLAFIILECFSNPTIFVFRPLWIQWRKRSVWGENEI